MTVARDERGASAVEYGLLIAGIAVVLALAVFGLGPHVRDLYTTTCDRLAAQQSPGSSCPG